jgi:hypothetical protein
MEDVMTARGVIVMAFALACLAPVMARAQSATPAAQPAAPPAAEPSRLWLVLGGASTTLRGDCQEDCPAHGTGAYLHTGSVLGIAGYRLSPHMDVGVEVTWVPATLTTGDTARSTFILGAAEYKPWADRGLFLKAAVGMAFVRNFPYDATGTLPPATSKGLGLSYSAGWTFRKQERVGLQLFGAQHVVALGDFQLGQTTVNDVLGNYWSVGAAIVIR